MISDRTLRTGALALVLVLVAACSGGGGGTAAPDVQPGPPAANGNVTPPAPLPPPVQPNRYAEAATATAAITGVTIDSPPVVNFSVVDGDGVGLTGLTSDNVRFHFAKLVPGANGDAAHWQSYINRLKTPAVHPENAPAVQATSERSGTLTDHGDGTYTYTFGIDVTNVTSPMAVPYEPTLTHRVAIQFSGGPVTNPSYDWIPATGATSGLLTKDVVSTESCNTCHNPLALHGGGRQEIELCVTCHNPGTSEPNSQENMDLAVLVHRIHMGRELPSVQAGGEFVVYGFRDSRHDYSHVAYPQDVNNCEKCHAGTATSANALVVTPTITSDGDNWSEVPTMSACGSCHDNVNFATHAGGQTDNTGCQSCHNPAGIAGGIAEDHRNQKLAAMSDFNVTITGITDTAPGQNPTATFTITDATGSAYDLATDPAWQGARLGMGIAFNTMDFTNTGNGESHPSYASTDILANAVSNGDGTYSVTAANPIPDGTAAPGRAASGSGMVTIEGRARKDLGNGVANVPFVQPSMFFAIDDASPQARREVVSIGKCNDCHAVKINHGDNRSNNIDGCAGCHNPRNTDKSVRAIAASPPTDGKSEESLDFKTMIHALHASTYRENPLQIVGFRGFSTNVFDEEEVQYPGRLADCNACHVNNSYALPLASNVLATTIDSGADDLDPADDVMVSATSSVCSSCHDNSLARTHMAQNGGDFMALESTANTETCAICHGPGRPSDVSVVHSLE